MLVRVALSRSLFALSFAALCSACSAPEPVAEVEAVQSKDAVQSKKVSLDGVSAIHRRLLSQKTSVSRRYTLTTPSARPLEMMVDSLDEGLDWFSMVGRAADSADSRFMLKGDQRGVYGWVVYRDRDLAYEFTTSLEGIVQVEQVPATKIFPVCDVPPEGSRQPSKTLADVAAPEAPQLDVRALAEVKPFPPHVAKYSGADVRKLQSRPDATKVWYIDLTDVMDGETPKSPQSKEDVFQVWAITAATQYSFKVNVTTDPDVYEKAGLQNSGCSEMIYEGIGESSGCGLNVFGTRNCCFNHIYADGYATGRIVNHEAGHGWGLLHDGGDNGGEYFNGFSEFQWTPLMGNVWPGDRWEEALFQYSKGEYDSASNHQDDFEIINDTLDYVEDDIADTAALTFEGTSVKPAANWGQIHRTSDTDSWTFKLASAGHATLKIDRLEDKGGAMLDVSAKLLDSTGKELAHDNRKAARYANLDLDLPAGDYKLVVEGGSEGTPEHGFPSYSSTGLYSIEGTITGAISGGVGTGGTTGMGGSSGGGGASGGAGLGGGATGGVGPTGVAGGGGSASGSAGTAGGATAGSAPVGGPVSTVPTSPEAGGCGCRSARGSSSGVATLLALLAALGITRRRRT
jgi:MYXO-CTERM domain-containing protein